MAKRKAAKKTTKRKAVKKTTKRKTAKKSKKTSRKSGGMGTCGSC